MRFVHMDCLNMWRFASANPQSSRLGSSETSGKSAGGTTKNSPRSNKEPTALDHDFIDHVDFRGRNHAENSYHFQL